MYHIFHEHFLSDAAVALVVVLSPGVGQADPTMPEKLRLLWPRDGLLSHYWCPEVPRTVREPSRRPLHRHAGRVAALADYGASANLSPEGAAQAASHSGDQEACSRGVQL